VTRARRPSSAAERRRHRLLREALDELVQHVRVIRRTLPAMAAHEVRGAQERLEWLADEVWRLALEENAEEP